MTEAPDPRAFGLHASTRMESPGKNHYTLVIDRKSRIIMKDGQKILEKATKIKSHIPTAIVDVRTTAPACSKTEAFLKQNGIQISQAAPP